MSKKLLIALAIFFVGTQQSFSQTKLVESGIIHYFTKYIEWSPKHQNSADFVISVLGKDEITEHLRGMASVKKVGAKSIVIKEINSIEEAEGSQILFLSDEKIGMFNLALRKAKADGFLLITEKQGYAMKGAAINFIIKDNKPSYEINASTMVACNLKFSSRLSSLGAVVKQM